MWIESEAIFIEYSLLPDSNRWLAPYHGATLPTELRRLFSNVNWAGLDLNQRRPLSQRIYNPSPLATRAPTPLNFFLL